MKIYISALSFVLASSFQTSKNMAAILIQYGLDYYARGFQTQVHLTKGVEGEMWGKDTHATR